MIKFIEKIVFSGADGRALLPLLVVLIYATIGQVGEFINEVKRVWEE